MRLIFGESNYRAVHDREVLHWSKLGSEFGNQAWTRKKVEDWKDTVQTIGKFTKNYTNMDYSSLAMSLQPVTQYVYTRNTIWINNYEHE